MDPLQKAFKLIGGKGYGAQSRFTKRLKLNQGFAWQILNHQRPVPPKTCILIERLTKGKVTAAELRPDTFDVPDEDGAG